MNKGNVHCFHVVTVGLAAKEQAGYVIRRVVRAFHCRACFLPEWGIVSSGLRESGLLSLSASWWTPRHRRAYGKPLVCWGDVVRAKRMTGAFCS